MLSEKIKRLVNQAGEASVPMIIMFGETRQVSPLQIWVDSRFLIDEDMVIVPREFQLSVGEQVILLRNAGGQQFLVLGRL